MVEFKIPPNRLSPPGNKKWSTDEKRRASELLGENRKSGMSVVWSRWGNEGKSGGGVNAREPINKQIQNSDRVENKTKDMGVRSPSKMKKKSTRAMLVFEGQPMIAHLKGISYVSHRPSEERQKRPAVKK